MIETNITAAFQEKVIVAVAGSDYPTMPIAFIDLDFDPPEDGKYLELVHIPNNPGDRTWGAEEVNRGIFRMILHWPSNGSGASAPRALMDSIASSFVKSEKIGGLLQVLNKPKAGSPAKLGNENLYPFTVEYIVFTVD